MYTFTPTKLSCMPMLEPELLALSCKASMSYIAKASSLKKELQLGTKNQKQIELLKIADKKRFSFESVCCNCSIKKKISKI